MTYPDGEVVHYDYNRGGMLKKVYGTVTVGVTEPPLPSTPHDSLVPLNLHGLGGQASLNSLPPVGDPVPLYDTHTYSYIDSIAYNEFELKSEVFYGNGTHALYAYDSLLRLLLLQSQTRTGDIMQDIVYTYDSVGNITSISNGAGMLPNGLGGTYNSAYTYDDLYRLTSSTGGWQGSQNISYRTTTLYRGNGRIKQKNLAARKLLNGVSDSVNYSHYYHYENTSQPNTLTRYRSSVWDPGSWLGISNEEDSQFGWDAAGNMTESCIGGDRNCRSLCWDEQNRLQGVKDKRWLSYYQYDAAGDRTYKLTGKGELQNINGEWRYFYHLDNATLYVSPYLVATKQGYTKHYYAETERIASRIGGGRLRYLDQPVVGQGKIVEKQSTNKTYAKEVLEECLDAIHSEGQADLHHLYDMINNAHSETDCYWYHPDHLGSSSWITDSAGTAVQHLHYLPWGEDFVNQRLNSFDGVRYTFSAKEKDSETGLSYFGSRYYSSDLSVWLSVDPMSDKYPHQSNYVYCSNNPLKVIDPDGEDEWEVNEVTGQVQHYSNNNPDKLFVTTAYGQRRDDVAPLDVDREVMQQLFSDETLTAFAGTNKRDEMSKMFDYLADNTYVEWTHVGASFTILNKDGCSTLTSDLLFTRHQFTSCSMRGTLEDFAENGVLDFHKHSHPNKYLGLNPYYREVYPSTSHIPSRSDIANKNSYPWGVPFRQPFFLLRNGKRNIYY